MIRAASIYHQSVSSAQSLCCVTSQFADDIFLAISSSLAGHAYHRIFLPNSQFDLANFSVGDTIFVYWFSRESSTCLHNLCCFCCCCKRMLWFPGRRFMAQPPTFFLSFSTFSVELRRVLFLHSFVQCSVGHSDHDWVLLLIRQTFFFLFLFFSLS